MLFVSTKVGIPLGCLWTRPSSIGEKAFYSLQKTEARSDSHIGRKGSPKEFCRRVATDTLTTN
jgi:hypothetical protein